MASDRVDLSGFPYRRRRRHGSDNASDSQDSDATHVSIHSDAATHVGGSALEEALEEFERISVGVETEGSFDGIEGRICGVYEAHERVIELLEAGAPLCLESRGASLTVWSLRLKTARSRG